MTAKRKRINWNIKPLDADVIKLIVDRAEKDIENYYEFIGDRGDAVMDLTAAHANGCPLDLRKLLNADEFNFKHDVIGIHNNINRKTGEIDNHFLPRTYKGD